MPIHREEKIWVGFVAAMIISFLAALAYEAWAVGFIVPRVPGEEKAVLIDVKKAFEELKPGVKEIAPGRYEVDMIAMRFSWIPNNITLKDPIEVKFRLTSVDVIHGFEIVGTNVNVMVFPGYVTEITWRVPQDAEGTYLMICNEYCGIGHQNMYGYLHIIR